LDRNTTIGGTSIDDRGFLVRIDDDPASDKHWLPGDAEPGDPTWNGANYHYVFAKAGFNNSAYTTGMRGTPTTSNEVYELAFMERSVRVTIRINIGDPECGDPTQPQTDRGTFEGTTKPVELSSFTATTGDGKVTLRWRTETETNNIGFNIYRSETKDGKFVKINNKLIEGQGNKAMPTDYEYVDKTAKPGKVYYYSLEDIDVEGNREKSDIVQSRSKRKLAATWAKLKRR